VNQAVLTKDHPQGDAVRHRQHAAHWRARRGLVRAARNSTAGVDLALTRSHQHQPRRSTRAMSAEPRQARSGARISRPRRRRFEDPPPHRSPARSSSRTRPPESDSLVATVEHSERTTTSTTGANSSFNGLRGRWMDQAYNNEFTVAGGTGTRTAVVSYATSPPADVGSRIHRRTTLLSVSWKTAASGRSSSSAC
jgi:hypothetical protein